MSEILEVQKAASDAPVAIYRRFDDGFIVRSMTPDDARIVQHWWAECESLVLSTYDLDIALRVFPASARAFYIGEINGEVVATWVQVPWGPNVLVGAYFFVDESHRGKGYGARMRIQVAFENVRGRILCIDSLLGKQYDLNLRFGFQHIDTNCRLVCVARQCLTISSTVVRLLPVSMRSLLLNDLL